MDPIFKEQVREMIKSVRQLALDMAELKEVITKNNELLVALTEKKEKPAK